MRAFFWLRPRTLVETGSFPRDWPTDCTWSAVVAADTEEEAREVAAQAGGDIWLDAERASCEEVRAEEFDVPCLVIDDAPMPRYDPLKDN